jgi:branched-chain amino acid transport system substrate-binding protein
VLAYLKAVDKVGDSSDGKAVVDAMKANPSDDPIFGKVTIREDGRAMHPVYLLQAKSPAESHEDWDYFKVVAPIPADRAFRPLSEGKCSLVQADH